MSPLASLSSTMRMRAGVFIVAIAWTLENARHAFAPGGQVL
jgi:hypothetical protein